MNRSWHVAWRAIPCQETKSLVEWLSIFSRIPLETLNAKPSFYGTPKAKTYPSSSRSRAQNARNEAGANGHLRQVWLREDCSPSLCCLWHLPWARSREEDSYSQEDEKDCLAVFFRLLGFKRDVVYHHIDVLWERGIFAGC